MNNMQLLIAKLKSPQVRNIVLVTHDAPDGDALGSLIALEELLIQLGKRVHIVLQQRLSKRWEPIVGASRVERLLLPPSNMVYDMAILIDCSSLDRTYRYFTRLSNYTCTVDHHLSTLVTANLTWVEAVPATAVLIHRLAKELNVMTPTMASALYCAYRADTGNYSFASVTPEIHNLTAELLNEGANTALVTEVLSQVSGESLRLLGEVLSHNLHMQMPLGLTYAYITQDVIQRTGCMLESAAGVIDYIRNVEGTEIAILFLEGNDKIRIRARSKHVNVAALLKPFNGGGHLLAAGAALYNTSLEQAIDRVIGHITTFLAGN